MKKYILLSLLSLWTTLSVAQGVCEIPLRTFVGSQNGDLPQSAKGQLASKLKALSARYGFGSSGELAQFYIYPEINILSQEVVPTTPKKYIVELEVSLFVEDAYDKKIFTSTTVLTKGIGQSHTKAYMQAIKNISPSNEDIADFFVNANSLIKDYYSTNYLNIIKKADNLATRENYQEAMFLLTVIPECSAGYQEALNAVLPIYQLYIDRQASETYQEALSIWSASLDSYGAKKASSLLATVSQESSSYNKAMALLQEIKDKTQSDKDLELQHYYQEIERQEKRYQDEKAHQRYLVQNYKEISLAYAKTLSDYYTSKDNSDNYQGTNNSNNYQGSNTYENNLNTSYNNQRHSSNYY